MVGPLSNNHNKLFQDEEQRASVRQTPAKWRDMEFLETTQFATL